MKRILGAVCLLSLLGFGYSTLASAQSPAEDTTTNTEVGLSVSPAIFETTIGPQERSSQELSIRNISPRSLAVQVSVRPAVPLEEIIDHKQRAKFNAADWVEIDEPYHLLEPGESRKLNLSISAPAEAEPGGHYATIVVQSVEAVSRPDTTGSTIAPQIGVLAFLTVPGDTHRELGLTPGRSLKRLHFSRQVTAALEIENSGNIHEIPSAKLRIEQLWGRPRATVSSRPQIVLPHTTRQFPLVWEQPPLFGVYRAQPTLTYGPNQQEVLGKEQYFLVVGSRILVAFILLGLIGAAFTAKTYRRWPEAWRVFKSAHLHERQGSAQPAKPARSRPTKKVKSTGPKILSKLEFRKVLTELKKELKKRFTKVKNSIINRLKQ